MIQILFKYFLEHETFNNDDSCYTTLLFKCPVILIHTINIMCLFEW